VLAPCNMLTVLAAKVLGPAHLVAEIASRHAILTRSFIRRIRTPGAEDKYKTRILHT
jgi:hypothetical protein